VVTYEDGPIAVDVAEGQRNDAPLALPMLAEAKAAMGRIDEVLGDRGYDSDAIRVACLDEHGARPMIPNKRGGKEPWPWDESMREAYRRRNRVELSFAKAKQYRRFTSRQEKLCEVFLGPVRQGYGFIHAR
jgi:transposase